MASNVNVDVSERRDRCCLKQCLQDSKTKVIGEGSQRVEVKAFEPKKKNDKLLISWTSDGSATFHNECWRCLIQATKSSDGLGAELTDVERSMVLEAKKTVEYFDSDSVIAAEAARIASIFKSCSYCIAFTGAGISTAAGIGDFRGKDGKWTTRDRAKNFGSKAAGPPKKRSGIEKLRPTYTHEALAKLLDMGVIKFIISQNVDGLHHLSGIPDEKIAELHGNGFTERCETCNTRYVLKHYYGKGKKDPSIAPKKCGRCKISHQTGRKCTKQGCKGQLMNTIINFGDYLESDVINTAEHHSKLSDAVLVLGSSLRVSPANDLVTMGNQPSRLIICNRQITLYDATCQEQGIDGHQLGSRVFCDCDKLMRRILEHFLSSTDLQKWEEDRDPRMAEYDLKRISV